MTENTVKLRVSEVFGPTVQGEGPFVGATTYFVRMAGCGYRCIWCDSMHAVDPKQIQYSSRMVSCNYIYARLLAIRSEHPYTPKTVAISGGDPLLDNRVGQLVTLLLQHDWEIHLETQGQFYREWVREIDSLVISPKPPSSEMHGKFDPSTVAKLVNQNRHTTTIKIPVADAADIEWALAAGKKIQELTPHVDHYYLSIVSPSGELQNTDTFRERILRATQQVISELHRRPNVVGFKVVPQMHALIWGDKQGV